MIDRDQYKELTDLEIQTNIAEFCGWTRLHVGKYDPDGHCFTFIEALLGLPSNTLDAVEKSEREGFGDYPPGSEYPCDWKVPDYLNDLNAMYEAEGYLNFSHRLKYYEHLRNVCSDGLDKGRVADIVCSHASASQRAEAFVLMISDFNEDGEEIIGDCECGWEFSLEDLIERSSLLKSTPRISLGSDGGECWTEYYLCHKCDRIVEYDTGT